MESGVLRAPAPTTRRVAWRTSVERTTRRPGGTRRRSAGSPPVAAFIEERYWKRFGGDSDHHLHVPKLGSRKPSTPQLDAHLSRSSFVLPSSPGLPRSLSVAECFLRRLTGHDGRPAGTLLLVPRHYRRPVPSGGG